MNKHLADVCKEFYHMQTSIKEHEAHILALMLIAEVRALKEAINNIDNITVQVNK